MQLFDSLQAGALETHNRIWMAPLTRCRTEPRHQPNALMAEYYGQRASAGLIITECTMILPKTSAFVGEPGIYNDEQIEGWRLTTDAVHTKGGKIFLQIWHAGRAAHPVNNEGQISVAPSAIAIQGKTFTLQGELDHVVPHELDYEEIAVIVAAFASAARAAIDAGFDGVEIHGANGYLIDQFLRDGSNKRQDPYGGSMENRARFLFEVLRAVSDEIGSDRVGLRLSPLNSYNDMRDSDPVALTTFLANELNTFNLAYVHLMRSDFAQIQQGDVVTPMRSHYKGVLVVNMGYKPQEAEQTLEQGQADAVAFGTGFLANPDLPERIRQNAKLNRIDPDTFYTPGPKGYTDYPTLDAA